MLFVADIEMHELKRRLLETESQMTRILQAMETVQDRVTDHVQDESQGTGEEEVIWLKSVLLVGIVILMSS